MKKIFLMAIVALGALSFSSCCNDSKCDNKTEEIHEGRVSTHTTKSHFVHQDITSEERELVKEHITNETAPGVSTVNIDAEGARIINESRKAPQE